MLEDLRDWILEEDDFCRRPHLRLSIFIDRFLSKTRNEVIMSLQGRCAIVTSMEHSSKARPSKTGTQKVDSTSARSEGAMGPEPQEENTALNCGQPANSHSLRIGQKTDVIC